MHRARFPSDRTPAPCLAIGALACSLALAACSDSGSPVNDDAEGGGGSERGEDAGVPPPSVTPVDASGAPATWWHGQVTVSEATGLDGRAVSRVAALFVGLTPDAQVQRPVLERRVDACSRVPVATGVPGNHDASEYPAGTRLPIAADLLAGDVDVGQTIVLSSPEGTWSTLIPSAVDDRRVYLNDSEAGRIDGRIPSGLVADIPGGGDFPGFASVALPDPLPGAGSFVPATGSRVTLGTVFRWSASSATGSRVHLAISDAGGRLDCFAEDDGQFSLTEGLSGGQALSGTARLIGVAREATRIERQGDATLVLTIATEAP